MPALSSYLGVMESLQQIFKQMETEAGNINMKANKIEKNNRAKVLFDGMKGAAKRVTENSMALLTFYETVHSRL